MDISLGEKSLPDKSSLVIWAYRLKILSCRIDSKGPFAKHNNLAYSL